MAAAAKLVVVRHPDRAAMRRAVPTASFPDPAAASPDISSRNPKKINARADRLHLDIRGGCWRSLAHYHFAWRADHHPARRRSHIHIASPRQQPGQGGQHNRPQQFIIHGLTLPAPGKCPMGCFPHIFRGSPKTNVRGGSPFLVEAGLGVFLLLQAKGPPALAFLVY